MKTDHWFYGLFQSAPDLITLLLPALYRIEASELIPQGFCVGEAFSVASLGVV